MAVVGIGTDIIEIERVKEVFRRNPRFGPKVFTTRELDYCLGRRNGFPHLAARFAAKEAVAKALGRSFCWHEVEITNGSSGKPDVRLYGRARDCADGKRVMLTMSHSHSYATATAVVVEDDQ